MAKSRNPRRRRAPRRKSNAPSKSFVKKVKKIIHGQAETKQAFHVCTSTSFNSGIDAGGDAIRVLPHINQGTADNARIGDQIRAQSLSIKGAIVYNPSVGQYGTYANARLGVRVMVIQPRMFSDITSVLGTTSSWMPNLLRKGGTNTAFTGVLNDLWAPINSDYFIKYYDKVFYLNAPYLTTAVGSTEMQGATKIFKHNFKLRNKLLKFDGNIGGGLTPTNYAPTFVVGYVHMDGSSPDVATTAIQVTWDAIFNYEDA